MEWVKKKCVSVCVCLWKMRRYEEMKAVRKKVSVNKNQRNLCEWVSKWARMRWQTEAKKNPCLWIGVRKYIAPSYMQTNQYHYQKWSVDVHSITLSLTLSYSMCVCVFVWIHLYFNIGSPSHSPLAMLSAYSYYKQFLCGLLLRTLFSTFILLALVLLLLLHSFPVAEWFCLSYFTFCTLGISFFLGEALTVLYIWVRNWNADKSLSLPLHGCMCVCIYESMEIFPINLFFLFVFVWIWKLKWRKRTKFLLCWEK